jgi:methionyl-tRNA formyltransferase
MKIVFFGSGEFGIPCLDALRKSTHKLVAVFTQAPHPAGRGRKIYPTPVGLWAKANSIRCVETTDINSPEAIATVAQCRPDLAVVIAFGQKIGKELISLPAKGAINVHSSLLPKYRGAAPINWTIINGDTQTGITIFSLVEKMDAGPICAQTQTEILPDETADHLHNRLANLAAPLLLETLGKIADGSVVYVEQGHSKATLARKLRKADGFIDFSEPAEVLRRKILGLWSWPGASALYVSKKTGKCIQATFALARIVKTSNPASLAPGVLDENLHVICGQDALEIIKLKPAGGHLMDFRDFANGRQTSPCDLFTKIEK